jgi:hypothetical protein
MRARPENHPAARPVSYARQWFRLCWAMAWLLFAAYISFVPRRPLPGGELPAWKQVAWVIFFAAGVCFAMTFLKSE